jgi:cytochrome c biogenesis protein CcmG/thiol:disulfide interchange protein DsbE
MNSTVTLNSTKNSPTWTRRRAQIAAVGLALVLVASACGSDGADTISLSNGEIGVPSGEAGEVDSGAAGTPVQFNFDDFDGESMALSDLPDGPVVLNFFASWCPTCIAEMPDFETVHQNFAGEVNFLGLATQDRIENAIELIEETGVTYQVGNDQNGEVFALFGGLGMPTTVFIDADHIVTRVHTGVLDVDSLTDTINSDLLP